MTTVDFVRHAQPVHGFWEDRIRVRPLALPADGVADSALAARALAGIKLDRCFCSLCRRFGLP